MQKHIKILDIFYGNKCNLACSNCDTRSDEVRTDIHDPDIDTIKESILLANRFFDVENWSVLGGEPLLYKDKVLEIIKFLRAVEPNKTIFLSTNGILLEKNIDWIVDLIKNFKIWIQVCNHSAGFQDLSITDKIIRSVHNVGKESNLTLTEPAYLWWYNIMKFDSSTDSWKEYVKNKGIDITQRDPNDITYLENNYGIHYMESRSFQTIYNIVDGKIKPFDSPEPALSYKNSCPSQFCAFLYNKKIYKCAALGTLNNFLEKKNLLEDPDWKKYLDYQPVDLTKCTIEDIENFSRTHYCHVDECSMCPSTYIEIQKTEKTVLPIYKK